MGPEEENYGSQCTSSDNITVRLMTMCAKVNSIFSIQY